MRNGFLFGLLFTLFGFGHALHGQNPHFLIRSNILTLPQPNLAVELEFQPVYNIGIIAGASTRDGLSDLGYLVWFSPRRGYVKCESQTYSLIAGLAYLHPIDSRWEIGGKLLYQYVRSFIYDLSCMQEYPNHSISNFYYSVNSHSVNLLPSARFMLTSHLFLEGVFGFGLVRDELNSGEFTDWRSDFSAQLNFGLKF
jgi:hypothetical protein